MSFLNKNISIIAISLVSLVLFNCIDELPGEGSIADKTLPSASFSYKASITDYREIQFSNLSISASSYLWDFSDGTTSDEKEPVHTFSGEGVFPVTLTVSDGNNVSSDTTINVEVIDQLIPEFQCPSFETCNSNRAVWGSYSGSGSPTPPDGTTGAKLDGGSASHILEQTITVAKGTIYKVSFFFVGDSSTPGENCGNLLIADGNDPSKIYFNEPVLSNGNKGEYVQLSYIIENEGAGSISDKLLFRITPGDKTGRYDLIQIAKY